MPLISVSLPASIFGERDLEIEATDANDLFARIRALDAVAFDSMFRKRHDEIAPKAFVVVCVNGEQVFTVARPFNDGDHVIFDVAIAGG